MVSAINWLQTNELNEKLRDAQMEGLVLGPPWTSLDPARRSGACPKGRAKLQGAQESTVHGRSHFGIDGIHTWRQVKIG